MPRYKYKCDTCKLTDVRSLDYRIDYDLVSTGEKVAVCPYCNEALERVWLKPPEGWFGNGRIKA